MCTNFSWPEAAVTIAVLAAIVGIAWAWAWRLKGRPTEFETQMNFLKEGEHEDA